MQEKRLEAGYSFYAVCLLPGGVWPVSPKKGGSEAARTCNVVISNVKLFHNRNKEGNIMADPNFVFPAIIESLEEFKGRVSTMCALAKIPDFSRHDTLTNISGSKARSIVERLHQRLAIASIKKYRVENHKQSTEQDKAAAREAYTKKIAYLEAQVLAQIDANADALMKEFGPRPVLPARPGSTPPEPV